MPVRVLYLVPDLFGPPGGIARYCRMIIAALHAEDFDPYVLSLCDQLNAHEAALGDEAMNQTASRLDEAHYEACGGNRRMFASRALAAVRQRQRPALVLCGHPNFAHLSWSCARLAKARHVPFIYGIDAWNPLPHPLRFALRHSDAVLSISRYTADRAAQANGVPVEKIRILHNCLDPQFECVTPPSSNRKRSLLTVARLSRQEGYKGHDFVIRAMPELLRRFPDLVYDVVGDGDARPDLEALSVSLGVSAAVRFHGAVSDDEVARHYAETAIFVMPSRCEGFGFVFIEAMAHGTPVIGGNQDATPEVIIDQHTGFTVNPSSVEEITDAISKLLSNESLRQRMGEEARRSVYERFGFVSFQKTLHRHLGELLEVEDGKRR